jgi:hypothetical protein
MTVEDLQKHRDQKWKVEALALRACLEAFSDISFNTVASYVLHFPQESFFYFKN